MNLLEFILIGLGLSMDAAAVSMTNGMVYRDRFDINPIAMPIFFGFFQGFMPLLGFFISGIFSEFITKYSNVIVFIILGIIGAKMIIDGCFHKESHNSSDNKSNGQRLTYKILLLQAIATSIDAFAVGVTFSAMKVSIFLPVAVIGLTTFLISIVAIIIGKRFGDLLGNKAHILGGLILISIAINSIL